MPDVVTSNPMHDAMQSRGTKHGIFPASIDPRKNISAFVASLEKSRLSEIKFIAGAR